MGGSGCGVYRNCRGFMSGVFSGSGLPGSLPFALGALYNLIFPGLEGLGFGGSAVPGPCTLKVQEEVSV